MRRKKFLKNLTINGLAFDFALVAFGGAACALFRVALFFAGALFFLVVERRVVFFVAINTHSFALLKHSNAHEDAFKHCCDRYCTWLNI